MEVLLMSPMLSILVYYTSSLYWMLITRTFPQRYV